MLTQEKTALDRELYQERVIEAQLVVELDDGKSNLRKAKKNVVGVKENSVFGGYHIELAQANDHVDDIKRRLAAQKAVVQDVRNRMRECNAALTGARKELKERKQQVKQRRG